MNIQFKTVFVLICLFLAAAALKTYGQTGQSVEELVTVNSNLVLAKPCPKGSGCARTWTLPSRFGEMLSTAEEMFGPRDYSYTFLGIDFTTENNPKNWYPFGKKDIIILLTTGSMTNEKQALFQLSHETFHVLSPILGKNGTTYFEEGLATWFSVQYMAKLKMPVTTNYFASSPKYVRAYQDIAALVKIYPTMAQMIKEFRKTPSFTYLSGINYQQFKQIFPDAPDDLVQRLTTAF